MKLTVALLLVFVTCTWSFGILKENVPFKKVVGGIQGNSTTTRYWDCCKATCAWPGHVEYKAPVKACKADGVTANDPENESGCLDNGESYTCNNQAGYAKTETLAYGFVAAQFKRSDVGTRNMCCVCLLFTFNTYWPSTLNGKNMLVQVTNTGNADATGDKYLFDIAMPGSGVGYYDHGCPKQWNNDISDWGDQYGGVTTEAQCYNLPQPLIEGCLFRFQWMAGYSNPNVTFVEVECPQEIVNISGCSAMS